MYRFSIIIPCYNVMEYLEECVDSVEKQDFKDYEILLINDGSTDATGDIAEGLSEKYRNIRYFQKENGGLSHTRNYGIDRAEGEYIYFLDSDDMLDMDALGKIDGYIKKYNNPDVIVTRYRELDDMKKLIGEKKVFPKALINLVNERYKADEEGVKCKNTDIKGFIRKAYSICYFEYDITPMAPTYIVKKDYIKNKKLYFKEHILHEDELWTPQVFLNAESISFLEESCYIYRVNRKNSIMNKISDKNIHDRLIIISELKKLALKDKDNADIYTSRCACILNGILGMDIEIKDGDLKNQIEANMHLMTEAVQKKYMIVYMVYKALGLKNTMKIVNFLK